MAYTSLSELNVPIQSIISTATGWQKIALDDQDGGSISGEYGTYSIKPIRAYGHPRTDTDEIPAIEPVPVFPWTDIRMRTISAMDVMVSINFFGDTAQDAALRMFNACFRPSISDKLYAAQIAWRYCSEARDLTYIEQSTIERRFQLDLFIYIEVEATDDIYRAAQVATEIQDEYGNVLVNSNSEIVEA